MTRPFNPRNLQFYMTLPTPCPYLPDRMERKIFTQIDPLSGLGLNDYLTHSGFRRSQNVLYRPACESCRECRSLRVLLDEFCPTKSMTRTLRRNEDLKPVICEAIATNEQFELLQRYLGYRHAGGGMADMDFIRYQMMAEDSVSSTEIVEYRDSSDTLIACALIDHLSDGISMVYSFFDPEYSKRSLGNYMILDHINRGQAMNVPYLYLGYWVSRSPKMDYKARFRPAEILGARGWKRMENSA